MAGLATPPAVELTVEEAPQHDVGLGRARIDKRTLHRLGIEPGGFVNITGKKSTVASVYELPTDDEGRDVVRADGLVRRNAKADLGDKVAVRKADVEPAQEVALAPVIDIGHTISFGEGIASFVRRGLHKRALTIGDTIIVPGIALIGGALPFAVVRTKPEASVQVVGMTVIEIREQPFRETEFGSPEERLKALLVRLVDTLTKFADDLGREGATQEGRASERAKSLRNRIFALLHELQDRGGD